MTKAIIFARVSSKEQEETGYSLPAQEKLLSEYAAKRDLKVVKKFSISESASGRYQREKFNEMMSYVKRNNIKVIVCEKVDRLTREFKSAVLIDDWLEKDEERQVHLVKDSLILHKNSRSQEKLNWGVRLLFAKNYVDNLSEEVKKGQREKISQGWMPTKSPLGYKTIGERGHKTHVIDEKIAPLVHKMFKLYATGEYSLKQLVEAMFEKGLRTKQGNKLVKSRMASILTDPFYFGKFRWNSEVHPGSHEPLVSKQLFDEVQRIMNGRTTPKYNKHFYLFKGMLRCAECGGTITWETQKGIIYGHCNHYRECKQKTWSKQYEVEQQIADKLHNFILKSPKVAEVIKKALKLSHGAEIEVYESSREELNNSLNVLQRRIEKIYDDKLDGVITHEFYQRKFKQYTDDKESVEDQLKKLSQANTTYYNIGSQIHDLSQRAQSIYEHGTDENKRKLANLVFESLKLDEGELAIDYNPAFSVLMEAVSATNRSKLPENTKQLEKIFEPAFLGQYNTQAAQNMDGLCTMLRGWDSNPRPIGYTLSLCFHKGWTISPPAPKFRREGARRFARRLCAGLLPEGIVSTPAFVKTSARQACPNL